MGYVLGIDLGTTYSAAATATDGRADRFPLGNRTPTIPSVVCLRADGEVLVGEAADRRALTEPGRTAREFKRRLGDPTPLILGGTPYGAEALSSHLLRWIVAKVTEQHGEAPDAIVVSHPANWGPYKLDLLSQTVRLAEVGDVSFITEPEAAAVHYARQERLEPGQAVAVYDFGGGTFDAAVLRTTSEGFELLGQPEGLERIGGIDFDQAVFAHVDQAIGGAISELDPSDTSAMAAVHRLRGECQLAKEQLSQDTDVDIPVLLPGIQTEVRLTRAEFESMIRPRIAETIQSLQRAVRSAGLTGDDIAKILLVGGTSRIPLVGQMVREATGRPIAVDAHPKFAIAIGAALTGAAGVARPAPTDATSAGAAAAAATEAVATTPAPTPAPTPDAAPPAQPAAPAPTPEPAAPAPTPEAEPVAAVVEEPPPPTPAAPAAPATPAPVAATASTATGGGADAGGRPAWMYAAAALVAVLAVVGVASAMSGGGEPEVTVEPGPTEAATTEASDAPTASETEYFDEPPVAGLPGNRYAEINGLDVVDGRLVPDVRLYNVDPTVNTVRYFFDNVEDARSIDMTDGGEGVWYDQTDTPQYDPVSFGIEERPMTANRICAVVLDEDGDVPVDEGGYLYETGNCHEIPWDRLDGVLPGDRFLYLFDLSVQDGTRYVVDYEAFNYDPAITGADGAWHLHVFWYPTYSKDEVGTNVGANSWLAWDQTRIDSRTFDVANRPDDATHICAVVAEYDHQILLQDNGLGWPSGTCVELPRA